MSEKKAEKALMPSNDLMHYIVENGRNGVAVYDKELKYIYVNQRYFDEFNIKKDDIIGKSHYELSLKLSQNLKYAYEKALHGEIVSEEEDIKVNEDGTVDWIRWECRPWYEKDISIGGIIVYIENINVRKKLEASLSHEKKLLETTLISVGDGVISCDNAGKVLFLNRVAEQLTGWSIKEAKGENIEEVFNVISEITREKSENIVKKVIKSKEINEMDNHTLLISKDGTERPIEDSAAPIMEKNGSVKGVVLVFRDFSAKRQKQQQIEFLSYHDQLTGLYNRRFYEEELGRLDTERNLPISILMGDVNGLKLINDSFGHAMGDELLKKVAQVIKAGCRDDDIIARLGGDEFIVLLPKTDSFETEKIISRIKHEALNEKLEPVDISISFGYDTKKEKREDIKEIFKKAEDHMYQEKLFESPSMRGRTIKAIINTLYEKNKREEKHSLRVSDICVNMGMAIGLSEHKIEVLKTVGLVHDIGKIAIEEKILNKLGSLTKNEWKEIYRHSEIGYRILSTVNDMSEIAEYVLYHHERWDGRGYPKGLKEEEIPIESRIIALVDAYDDMTSTKNYKEALTNETALFELAKNSGTQFDPELVNVFLTKVIGEIEKL